MEPATPVPPQAARTTSDADADVIAGRVVALPRAVPASRAIEAGAIYTVTEACALAKMHPDVMRKKLRTGEIRGRNKCGWRIMGSELLKFAQ